MGEDIQVTLLDDHVLLRNGLAGLVANFGFTVLSQYDNGKAFINGFKKDNQPDIVLMDINMPVMDGYETTLWLKKNFPDVKVLALSMYDDENAIIRMLKNGAKGYILKDADPAELKQAIQMVLKKGFYYSEMVTGKLIHSIGTQDEDDNSTRGLLKLSERELEFLKLVCTEMTYKEIADRMFLSPRTIDGYRDALFEKLNIKTRVGLVLYAIKTGIVHV
jgi:DNA-binding NarL/FixJ family response regulator